jgi:hypothetical protein
MRSIRLRATFLVACTGALSACAALSGLDQITESICAPNGCADASVAPVDASLAPVDAPPVPATDDADPPPDVTVEPVDRDQAAGPDVETAFDGSADAGSDVTSVSPGDAATDAPLSADAGAGTDASDAGCGPTVYFQDSFASNANGWTLDTDWAIAAECATPPAPQKGNPDPAADHTGTSGSGALAAFLCGNNPTGVTTPFLYATSPVLDVSGAVTLELAFWRWLNTDASGWMASTVDVYDGSAWVNVYTNPSGAGNLVTDAAWTPQAIDVIAQKNAAFQVRFGYSIANAEVYAMSAWNVDDVSIAGTTCE